MRRLLAALWSPRTITQFISVGVVGATLETILVAAITIGSGLSPLAAKAIGAECSISVMFLLNDRLTFADDGVGDRETVVRRWGRSHIVRIGGLTVAFAILWALTAKTTIQIEIAGADLWPTVANMIGIGVGMVFNYVGESLFTWDILVAERTSKTNSTRSTNDND
jgi:putative flippase GtrA